MPYTTEEGGRLNNFAREPKVYQSEPPTKKQQVQYLIFGGLGLALIVGLIAFTLTIPTAS